MLVGKPVKFNVLQNILEVDRNKLTEIGTKLDNSLKERISGIQVLTIDDSYQLSTVEKYYDKICVLLDNRPKPSLSQAAMEVLAIIAYNPKITRAEIEKIRGVSSDSALNKLIEYGLVEEGGRSDAPGRPMTFKTSDDFLRLFGYSSLKDMPELPRIVEEDPQIQMEELSDDEQPSLEDKVEESLS